MVIVDDDWISGNQKCASLFVNETVAGKTKECFIFILYFLGIGNCIVASSV
jgi:hypothetical protein